MATGGVNVHTVMVQQHTITVDVDRYAFRFLYKPLAGNHFCLFPVDGRVHGQLDDRIAGGDMVAKAARAEAFRVATESVARWLSENPSRRLIDLQGELIWFHPDYEPLTDEELAANRLAVNQMIGIVAERLGSPFNQRAEKAP